MNRVLRVVLSAAAVAGLGFAAASPAAAATSQQFAGYAVAPPAGFQSASAVLRIPTIDCSVVQTADGLAYVMSTSANFVGGGSSIAGVQVGCNSGVEYAVLLAFDPAGDIDSVYANPGDQVRLAFKRAGGKLVVSASSGGQRVVVKGVDAEQSVVVGLLRGFSDPEPTLPTVAIQPLVDSASIASQPLTRYTMVDGSGVAQYTASKPLYAGGGFKIVSHLSA